MSKLLMAVVHDLDADKVIDALQKDGYRVTRLRSSGGFLRLDNSTLVLGLEDDAVPAVLSILERECTSRELELPPVLHDRLKDYLGGVVHHGGATVFIGDLDRIVQI